MPEEKMVSEWALEWLEKQMQQGLSRNSIRCGQLILRRLLDEAGREGLLEINPTSELKLSYQVAQEQKVNRRGQVKRYLEEIETLGAYPILYMMLTSGLRQARLPQISLRQLQACAKEMSL